MTRIVNRPIEIIEVDEFDTPRRFMDRGVIHTVLEIVDQWRESGNWWEGEGPRDMFQVITEYGVYQLQSQSGKWMIYKVLD